MSYTAESIVTEGFKRAGRCIGEKELKRGVESILAEVKHDIWLRRTMYGITQLRSLAADSVMITKVGVSRYQLPDDFNEAGAINLLRGRAVVATDTGAASCSAALDSDLLSTDLGKRVVWLNGTAEAYSQEISSIAESSDFDLTLEAPFEAGHVPAAGNSFMVVDGIDELDQLWHDELDAYAWTGRTGRPQEFFVHSERLQLDRPCDAVYALRMRYYVDITKVAANSKIDEQINRRWYSVLVKGVYWIAAQELGDTVARDAYAQFQKAVEDLKWQDQDRGADDQRFAFVPWR